MLIYKICIKENHEKDFYFYFTLNVKEYVWVKVFQLIRIDMGLKQNFLKFIIKGLLKYCYKFRFYVFQNF